jgi:hypothetical protein
LTLWEEKKPVVVSEVRSRRIWSSDSLRQTRFWGAQPIWNEYNGNKKQYYFWRTHTKQQMDFIEVSNDKVMAYKSIWDKRKKPKFPASFKKYYPEAGTFALNRSTYWGFLSKK